MPGAEWKSRSGIVAQRQFDDVHVIVSSTTDLDCTCCGITDDTGNDVYGHGLGLKFMQRIGIGNGSDTHERSCEAMHVLLIWRVVLVVMQFGQREVTRIQRSLVHDRGGQDGALVGEGCYGLIPRD